jgi:hypothetical protein
MTPEIPQLKSMLLEEQRRPHQPCHQRPPRAQAASRLPAAGLSSSPRNPTWRHSAPRVTWADVGPCWLGAGRVNGAAFVRIAEVRGSNPLSSTRHNAPQAPARGDGCQLGQDPAVAGRSGGGAIPLASGVEACRSSSPNALVIERSAVVTSLGMTQNVLPELWASWGRVWRYW